MVEEQVQLARIGEKVDSMAKMQEELMPKVVHALERIARTEERQTASTAHQRKMEIEIERQRVAQLDQQRQISALELKVDRNTGWRGIVSKAGWAIAVVVIGLAVKDWWAIRGHAPVPPAHYAPQLEHPKQEHPAIRNP